MQLICELSINRWTIYITRIQDKDKADFTK